MAQLPLGSVYACMHACVFGSGNSFGNNSRNCCLTLCGKIPRKRFDKYIDRDRSFIYRCTVCLFITCFQYFPDISWPCLCHVCLSYIVFVFIFSVYLSVSSASPLLLCLRALCRIFCTLFFLHTHSYLVCCFVTIAVKLCLHTHKHMHTHTYTVTYVLHGNVTVTALCTAVLTKFWTHAVAEGSDADANVSVCAFFSAAVGSCRPCVCAWVVHSCNSAVLRYSSALAATATALFYCCYTNDATRRRRQQRRRHHRQRQRRCSVWFGSLRFGFGSFVRLSVTQWVERTLGLAGFVSHGCGYICMHVCMCMFALSIVVFPLCSKYAALCIVSERERESCTCNAAFVFASLSRRAAPRSLFLSLSFACAANSIDARIFQMPFLRRK